MSPASGPSRHRPRPSRRGARPGSASGSRRSSVRSPTAGTASYASTPPEARVVFVRHAIPGERVVLEITEGTDGDRFWRGDAVEVLEPSPDRVAPPCPYAGPGLCGGCDFQHVALAAQRALKADVVREQLRRLAGLDLRTSRSRRCPATTTGCAGAPGSATSRCPDGGRGDAQAPLARRWCRSTTACSSGARDAVATHVARVGQHASRSPTTASGRCTPVRRDVLVDDRARDAAARSRASAVLDLYAGVGLFAAFLPTRSGSAAGSSPSRATARACRTRRHATCRAAVGVEPATVERGARDVVRRALRPGRARPAARGRPPRRRRAGRRPRAARRSPTSPATRPPWPATSRPSPSTATRCASCAPSTSSR